MQHVHLIGICGTGMASLAGLFLEAGWRVTGSDSQAYPPMSTMLEGLGIEIKIGYRPENLQPQPDLVIVGNVCTPDNPEARAAIDSGLKYSSMADAVADYFCAQHHSIVATGTHGKTTTSSMLAWLLESAGDQPGFLIGGMPGNFPQSYRCGTGTSFVVEGDEYDTAFFDKTPKFLHYPANTLIVGPVEFDHADIYNNLEEVLSAFRQLIAQQPADTTIIADFDSQHTRELVATATGRVIGVSTQQQAEAHAQVNITTMDATGTRFTLAYDGASYDCTAPFVGEYNVRNAAAALLACLVRGLDPKALLEGLTKFSGIRRRQEVIGVVNDITIIDDFAHHPTAIGETLRALRARYPKQRFIVGFDPRSNTSGRNIFHEAYLQAFREASHVYFAPVHKTDRIPETERLDITQLTEDLRAQDVCGHSASSYDEMLESCATVAQPGDVMIFMSNGDFGNIHRRLKDRLETAA